MIRTLWGRIVYIFWHRDMLATRFSLAFGSLIWAALLWWPGDLFTPSRVTYRLMSQIADEDVWGLAFAMQGTFMLLALVSEPRNKLIWCFDALFGALLWTLATVTCFASHWQIGTPYAPPAAMSAEVALMFASWWHLIRNPWGDKDV